MGTANAGRAAVLGGLLWIPFGVFEFYAPLGTVLAYDASQGYDVVVDRAAFTVSALPGALALALTAAALLRLRPAGRRTGRAAATFALAMGCLAAAGTAAAFVPLFIAPLLLGTLVLGVGTLQAARATPADGPRPLLYALGIAAIAVLALWPLYYAVAVLPAVGAVALIAALGLGWARLGVRVLNA